MKKALKIAGWTAAGLAGLVVVAMLLIRYCFSERVAALLHETLRQERIELLQAAGGYAPDSVSFRFVYRQDTARARAIGAYFRPDTLADPSQTTWERTLAAARFVARHIPHANQSVYPERPNAIGLWEYSRTVEPAFNCRLHAIFLHELLLAQGIANRFVTCLPADPEDNDCHVVNIVWLPERRKWAMIDSDMQAYAVDAAGVPLSLAEMRSRYLADEAIDYRRLTDGRSDEMTYYRSYWAKNLYWFECWEETGYDREAGRKGSRIIALVPPGFGGFRLGRDEALTHDEARFWAAPEGMELE